MEQVQESHLSVSDASLLKGIQPIPLKKTLLVVNEFLVQTTDFMNKFSELCETKLRHTQQKIARLEVALSLVETKLNSVPWLAQEGFLGSSSSSQSPNPASASSPIPPAVPQSSAPPPPSIQVSETPSISPEYTYSTDPRFSYYFRMMRMGAARAQLSVRLTSAGFDPTILEMDPDAPAPPMSDAERIQYGPKEDENEDDDF